MRHGKQFNHLSRKAGHRKALLTNLAQSLILHKRIQTTLPKAKALRAFVEPLITKAKQDSTHSRRLVFSYFQHKAPVKELFDEVVHKVGDRPGGYTRIIRLENRPGDNAACCLIELVDYNTCLVKGEDKKTRRTRRAGTKKQATKPVEEGRSTVAPKAAAKEEAAVGEEVAKAKQKKDEKAAGEATASAKKKAPEAAEKTPEVAVKMPAEKKTAAEAATAGEKEVKKEEKATKAPTAKEKEKDKDK